MGDAIMRMPRGRWELASVFLVIFLLDLELALVAAGSAWAAVGLISPPLLVTQVFAGGLALGTLYLSWRVGVYCIRQQPEDPAQLRPGYRPEAARPG